MQQALPALDYTRYYRHWHDGTQQHFDAMARYFADKLKPSLVSLNREARILEVGCGGGFALGGLHLLGFRNAVGCDADAGQVADAVRCGVAAAHVPVAEFAGWLATQAANGFDAVLLFDVLEHVPVADQRPFLFTLRGALRDGGLILCQVPNANSILFGRYRYGDWTHSSAFTEHSLDFVLFNSGFDDIVVTEADPPVVPPLDGRFPKALPLWLLRVGFRALRRLQFFAEGGRAFARAPMTPNILATARRPATR
jgi:SAM-dependent methyltransferase